MPGLEVYLATNPTLVTVDTLVRRVRTKLFESTPWQDILTAAYTAGGVSISLGEPTTWSEGQVLEFDDSTGSQARIFQSPPIANPVTVQMGYNGTADADHAAGCVVLQNPEFTYDVVQEAITRTTLSENWAWAYVVQTTQLTPSTTVPFYAVPQDFLSVVAVTQKQQDDPLIVKSYGIPGGLPVQVQTGLRASIAATTQAFVFPNGLYNMDNVIDVSYAARITADTIPDGDIAEYIALRSAERLLGAKEIPLTASNQARPAPPPGSVPGSRLRSSLWAKSEADSLRRSIRAQMGTIAPLARRWIP